MSYNPYHWCVVPKCKNTSIKTPVKLWIQVPTDVTKRKTWLQLAGRDSNLLSEKSRLYFCEDHFDLENDMENYVQYKIMGSVKKIIMKPHCTPSRFDCQVNRKRQSISNLSSAKKQRSRVVSKEVDHVEESSSCIEDSRAADNSDQMCQIQELKTTQVVRMQEHKGIEVNLKNQCTSVEEQDTLADLPEVQVVIANVYHYLEKELQSLKSVCKCCDLTPFCNVLQRTAQAVGVSQRIVSLILGETGTRHQGIEPETETENSLYEIKHITLPGNRNRRQVKNRKQGTTADSETERKHKFELRRLESNPLLTERQVTVKIEPCTEFATLPEDGISKKRIESASVSVKRWRVDQAGNSNTRTNKTVKEELVEAEYDPHAHSTSETTQDPLSIASHHAVFTPTNETVKEELVEDDNNEIVKLEFEEDEYDPHAHSISETTEAALSIASRHAVFTPTEMKSHPVKSEPPED